MLANIKKHHKKHKDAINKVLTSIGASMIAIATLISTTDVSRLGRDAIVTLNPAPAFANPAAVQWARNDSENETVHMPTKYDIGLRIAAVTGKK